MSTQTFTILILAFLAPLAAVAEEPTGTAGPSARSTVEPGDAPDQESPAFWKEILEEAQNQDDGQTLSETELLLLLDDTLSEGVDGETPVIEKSQPLSTESFLATDAASIWTFSRPWGCGDGVPADGELCFKAPVRVVSNEGSLTGIDVGRINGGSNPDFVAASASKDKIKIKLGNGHGGFWGTYNWTMGDGPTDVSLADFNGDGHTDIIATNVYTKRVRIRWGATSSPWSHYSSYTTGDGPYRLSVGDLNRDGRDDFVTVNVYDDSLTVRLRRATGGFTKTTLSAFDARDVELADCDNDGDLDLIYPSGSRNATIKIRRNNGNGVFGSARTVNMGSDRRGRFHAVTLADWNEDGKLDLIAAHNDHKLVQVLGRGGCRFGAPRMATTRPNPGQLYSADFDRDGHLDLAVAHPIAEGVSIYLGVGNGDLYGPRRLGGTSWVYDLGIGDFNRDGSPDVVYNSGGSVYILNSDP